MKRYLSIASMLAGLSIPCLGLIDSAHSQTAQDATIANATNVTTPVDPPEPPTEPADPPVITKPQSIISEPMKTWVFRNIEGSTEFDSVAIRVFQDESGFLEGRMSLYKNGRVIDHSCAALDSIIKFTLERPRSRQTGLPLPFTYEMKTIPKIDPGNPSSTEPQLLGWLKLHRSKLDPNADVVLLRLAKSSILFTCDRTTGTGTPGPIPNPIPAPTPDSTPDSSTPSVAAVRGCDEPPVDDMGEEEEYGTENPVDAEAPPVELPEMP